MGNSVAKEKPRRAVATAPQPRRAVATPPQPPDVKKELAAKFMAVTLKKTDVDKANELMNVILVSAWNENMVHDVTRKVLKKNIPEFEVILLESLGLDDKPEQAKMIRGALRKISLSTGENATAVTEIGFNVDSFKSMYGFICTVEDQNGTVAIAYAFHALDFKISEKKTGETANLNIGEIQAMKNVFSKQRALEELKSEGIIPFITYE